MIDSIRGTIALSVRQGSSQARIALAPAELGDIRIHLSQTSQGLTARVTAGTAAAAQVLAQGRPELQRALSSLGLSLLSLDIGLSGQGAAGQGSMQGGPRGTSGGSTASEEDSAEPINEGEQGPQGPAKGELVDVLA
jgi:flagellar hook-length control protein FliK